jgi:hypothetical protein
MRLLRFLLRLLGWLLTPLVAWAASFSGAVLGAALAGGTGSAVTGVVLTIGMGFAFAILGTHGWLRMIRKSPELQQALHLAPDGTPVTAAATDGDDR